MNMEIVFGFFDYLETEDGTEYYPKGTFNEEEMLKILNSSYKNFFTSIKSAKEAESYELVEGWFGRLPMPGYLDCTYWSGPFETKEKAEEWLSEMYGENDENC